MEIKPGQLSEVISTQYNDYAAEVMKKLSALAEEVGKDTVKRLKQTSPKRTGKYAKGWAAKAEKSGPFVTTVTVYNKNKPSLTHLLEHGHPTRDGGRVDGRPHIEPAEQEAVSTYKKKAEEIVNG